MNPEALIIRRCYPVPVTFADLRAAYAVAYDVRWRWRSIFMREWFAALKDVTGAIDEVYAVVDGREVRISVLTQADLDCGIRPLRTLLEVADEQGYWERPHEIRLDLSPRPVSHNEVTKAVLVGQEYVERHAVK